ncbi:cyclin-dependent kinase 9 isoform X1 [Cinclus cinclus]|uniref:cyclin-dependent kinase 9 isoform X1 n=1 Tax=Cinclus cinclus TaxID=127875 RepID=UPI002E12F20D
MAKQYDMVECPFCDEVSKYEKLAKIGQGTFGEVFKAKHRQTGKKVALKKVLMENEKEGFPITALREIKILQLLKHENVVNLIEICRTKASPYNRCKGSIYLVFDFCEHDLAGLLSNAHVKFTLSEIKKVMQMLLNGLYYIHRNKILHRDMKAANVLITRDGVLKLADFGLARAFSLAKNSQPNRYTNRVVTLWYRPPELLLGERDYGPPIDLWGAGCIMAEMWTRSPIMQGNTEQHQLTLISQLCGSITPEVRARVGMSCGEQECGEILRLGTPASSLPCVLAAVCSQQWGVPAAASEAGESSSLCFGVVSQTNTLNFCSKKGGGFYSEVFCTGHLEKPLEFCLVICGIRSALPLTRPLLSSSFISSSSCPLVGSKLRDLSPDWDLQDVVLAAAESSSCCCSHYVNTLKALSLACSYLLWYLPDRDKCW